MNTGTSQYCPHCCLAGFWDKAYSKRPRAEFTCDKCGCTWNGVDLLLRKFGKNCPRRVEEKEEKK